MEERTYRGEWWLPTEPDTTIDGSLVFDPRDGATLELHGSLDNKFDALTPRQLDKLYGEVYDEGPVTLKDLHISHGTRQSGGRVRQIYDVNLALVRHHFENEIRFSKLSVSFPNLVAWAGQKVIDMKVPEEDFALSARKLPPQTVDADINGIQYKLGTGPEVSRSFDRIEFKQSSSIMITPQGEAPLDEYRNRVLTLQRYFSLACGKPVHPTEVRGFVTMDEPNRGVDVLYRMPWYSPPSGNLSPHQLHFIRPDIDYEHSLSRWFNHADEASDLHDLYFSVVYDPDMSTRYSFLALSIALESYYNYHYPDHKPMEPEAFSEFHENLISSIPNDIPVKSRIDDLMGSIVNDLSFKDKIERVVLEYESIMEQLLDIEDAVKEITATRHGIVHALDMEKMSRAASNSEELIQLTARLKVIIEAILYTEIGLDENHIADILQDRYSWSL